MPRRNRNVVQSRAEHRIELLDTLGLALRAPGRRVSRKSRRKGCAV
ncbi:hypothetical protein [Streptomyces sp. N50]|nr:hypothetical protein [Streptomyces sp. N50]WOX09184.1 hypothetical protein R2B38_09920 [Streptomyces sp. N50]